MSKTVPFQGTVKCASHLPGAKFQYASDGTEDMHALEACARNGVGVQVPGGVPSSIVGSTSQADVAGLISPMRKHTASSNLAPATNFRAMFE